MFYKRICLWSKSVYEYKAYREKHQMPPVAVPTKGVFVVCEAIGYICFVSALLALAVYVLLQAV